MLGTVPRTTFQITYLDITPAVLPLLQNGFSFA
jgi:hypothetical protein